MKYAMIVCVACLVLSVGASAQFKAQTEQEPSPSQSLVRPFGGFNSFFGLLNPDNFRMQQNFSYSFLSSGGQGLSLASYTNSIFYRIADPLNVRFDVTLQGTPFGAATPYQSALNGLFLSRAELNYRPWQNFFIKLEYDHLPSSFYNSYYNPWYYPFPSASEETNAGR
jgi:hypothetical protein